MTQYSVLSTPSRPVARTPLDQWHTAHGARFTQLDGWRIPAAFTTLEEEVAAARSGVGLADISAFAKTIVSGSGVPAVVRKLTGGGPPDKPGGVAWIDAREPHGTARIEPSGPVLACRLSDDRLLLLAESPHWSGLDQRLATVTPAQTLRQHDASSAYTGFELIGPQAETVLRRLTGFDLSTIATPVRSCAEANVAGIHAILIRVPNRRLATRVYVSWEFGEYAWTRLLDARPKSPITPIGLEAWQRLALEVKG